MRSCGVGAPNRYPPSPATSVKERARLYFRYRPIPNLLAAADPERVSHRAFGLPNVEFTQDESDWPRKVAMSQLMSMKINVTGELPEPLDPFAAWAALNQMHGYETTDADQQDRRVDHGQHVDALLAQRRLELRHRGDVAPAIGTVEPTKDADQDRRATAIVVDRHLALSGDRVEHDIGRNVARLERAIGLRRRHEVASFPNRETAGR